MPDEPTLNKPWLVAVWPGMGHVAISAGYYLMAKLGMHLLAEFSATDLFDVEHVEVKDGVIQAGRFPRNRLFAWVDPKGQHDIVVFIGEAQPPSGKYAFCRGLIEFAKGIGVERVFTFAAMATPMRPDHEARVFGAATDTEGLSELQRPPLEVEMLEDGQISGLNGVLLGAAVEGGLRGACLLGEMPHVLAQLPFPKASLAVLRTFSAIADLDIDLDEMAEQAREMEQKLGDLLEQVEQAMGQRASAEESEEEEATESEPEEEEEGIRLEDRRRIEQLFQRARQDRSAAYELKRELDRLGLYREHEDRFLDLFKKAE